MSYHRDLLGGALLSSPAATGTPHHALSQVPDRRSPRGQSYPLCSLLLLMATAGLCGARSLGAVAQWGRDSDHLAPLLGFTRPDPKRPGSVRTPCVSELHTVLAALGVRRFERALADWIGSRGVADLEDRAVHADGKRLRGRQGHRLPGVHLAAASCPDVEGVLARLRVEDANEHKAAPELLQLIPPRRAVVTGDAAFPRRDFCQAIVDGGGDSFLPVKDNQPALGEAIETGFRRAFPPRERRSRRRVDRLAESRDKGHGRHEYRRRRASARLNEYTAPGRVATPARPGNGSSNTALPRLEDWNRRPLPGRAGRGRTASP